MIVVSLVIYNSFFVYPAHLTTRDSGMSFSAYLELPNDSIRGSNVKKFYDVLK
jgi:hypothetical protein